MNPKTIADTVIQRLEDAWNAADGAAYGAPFASDADFVTVRGELHHSAAAIAAGHQQIFDTIYAGSTNRCTVLDARELGEDVILAHVDSRLSVPTGPLAGELAAIATVVLARDGDEHRIAAYHNTPVASG